MAEAQRFINPWVLHVQKLGLELKCPLCLSLLNRPMLLPCNHIFCNFCIPKSTQFGSECPSCKHEYIDKEVRPAPYLENIVTIYRNLDAIFSANLFQPVYPDAGRVSEQYPCSFKVNANDSARKKHVEIPHEGNSSNERSTPPPGHTKDMEVGIDGIQVDQIEQLSLPSADTKGMCSNSSDQANSNGLSENFALKRHLENGTIPIDMKKQKKLSHELQSAGQTDAEASHLAALDAFSCKLDSNFVTPLPAAVPPTAIADLLDVKSSPCAFCHSSDQKEGTGPILCYANGREVKDTVTDSSKAIYVHEKCIGWAPRIFFEDGIIKNLKSEVTRANRLKCSSCGKKGAGLGCYVKTCNKTYHIPCAYDMTECRWDCDDFLLLCPKHQSAQFPSEKEKSKTKTKKKAAEKSCHLPDNAIEKSIPAHSNSCTVTQKTGNELVFCGSALSSEEKYRLVEFARICGATVSKYWRPNVTHVIAATDVQGACTRTFKLLMGILNGKWILTMEWVKACVETGHLVNEAAYEVSLDNHGCSGGPKAGRHRVLSNAPKLFDSINFYFCGKFVQAFKDDLLDLVRTAGGIIIESKEKLLELRNYAVPSPPTLIVYDNDLSDDSLVGDEDSFQLQRLAVAEGLGRESGFPVIGHTLILESIAACSLQPLVSR